MFCRGGHCATWRLPLFMYRAVSIVSTNSLRQHNSFSVAKIATIPNIKELLLIKNHPHALIFSFFDTLHARFNINFV